MEKLKQEIRNYQLQSPKVISYEKDKYSEYQNYLYKRAIYGLNALNEEELATMCSKKKQRIVNVYKKAQVVINKLKQQVTIQYSNFLFKTLFPESPITAFLLADTEVDEKMINKLTFKDLKIKKEQIIAIFISEGVLPKNFLSLESPQNQLPRLRNGKEA
jgi:fructose-bisphosphate aldolase class 1